MDFSQWPKATRQSYRSDRRFPLFDAKPEAAYLPGAKRRPGKKPKNSRPKNVAQRAARKATRRARK